MLRSAMEHVEVLKDARAMVTEWVEVFECPRTLNTRVMREALRCRIEKAWYNDGVILTSTFCEACHVAGVKSWVAFFCHKHTIDYANSHDTDFKCPKCKVVIVPTPLPPTAMDRCDLSTVHVLHELTYAEVHVLQEQLEADRRKIQDLEKALKMKEEYIQKLQDDETGACAKTFMHCLKRPRDEGELNYLVKLSSTQPDTFRSLVKHEVFAKK